MVHKQTNGHRFDGSRTNLYMKFSTAHCSSFIQMGYVVADEFHASIREQTNIYVKGQLIQFELEPFHQTLENNKTNETKKKKTN